MLMNVAYDTLGIPSYIFLIGYLKNSPDSMVWKIRVCSFWWASSNLGIFCCEGFIELLFYFFAITLKIHSSAALLCGIVTKKSALFASFGSEVLKWPQTKSMRWYIRTSDTLTNDFSQISSKISMSDTDW